MNNKTNKLTIRRAARIQTEASEKVWTICLPEKPRDPRTRVATQKVRLWSWVPTDEPRKIGLQTDEPRKIGLQTDEPQKVGLQTPLDVSQCRGGGVQTRQSLPRPARYTDRLS